jgi:hypothetical protein
MGRASGGRGGPAGGRARGYFNNAATGSELLKRAIPEAPLELRRKITDPGVSLKGNGKRPRAKDTGTQPWPQAQAALPFILRRSHAYKN